MTCAPTFNFSTSLESEKRIRDVHLQIEAKPIPPLARSWIDPSIASRQHPTHERASLYQPAIPISSHYEVLRREIKTAISMAIVNIPTSLLSENSSVGSTSRCQSDLSFLLFALFELLLVGDFKWEWPWVVAQVRNSFCADGEINPLRTSLRASTKATSLYKLRIES